MTLSSGRTDPKFLVSLLVLIPFLAFLCQISIAKGAFYSIAIISGILVCFITLIKTEWALVVLIFATLLSPEVAVGEGGGRDLTIRVEDVLLFVISITWLAKIAINKEIGFVKTTPLNGAIKIYVLLCIVSTLVGVLRGFVSPIKGTFFVLKYIEYFVLYFLVVNNMNKQEQIKLLLGSFFVVCFVITLYGLTQVGSTYRVSAPFEGDGEPNTFGGYLMFLFSLSLGLFLYSDKFQFRVFFGSLCALTCAVLMFTLSRGSYLGITAAFITFFILTKKGHPFLIFGLLCFVVGILLFPGRVIQRILYTFSVWNPEITDGTVRVLNIAFDPSSSARIMSWLAAITDWSSSPLIGRGVGGSGLIDCQYFTVLVETGFIGLILFLFLLWKVGTMALRSYKEEEDPFYKGLFLGYVAGFVGLLFHCVTANTFILIRIMEPFWFMTAVLVALPQVRLEEMTMLKEKSEKGGGRG